MSFKESLEESLEDINLDDLDDMSNINETNVSIDKMPSVDDVIDELFSEGNNNNNYGNEEINFSDTNDNGHENDNGLDNFVKKSKNKKFIWNNLDEKWNTKLLNNNFRITDSLPDGNCQFRSIETALQTSGVKVNHIKLRKLIVKYINNLNNNDFERIIQNYRLEKDNGEFIGHWNPYFIKTKRDFNREIQKPGFNFQGDNVTLSLLCDILLIDFIILDDNYNIIEISNKFDNIIILHYTANQNSGHYQTIGLSSKRGKVTTLFKRHSLPDDILILIDKNKFVLKHVEHIIKNEEKTNTKLTLNMIIERYIKNAHDTRNSASHKRGIIKIINTWLHNEKFFKSIKKIEK